MKKYLIDPNLMWCKANMHCHTIQSDGQLTPEEIKKAYMEHGYKIVCFTDHETIFDNSYLTDENFIAITSAEYSINKTHDDNGNPLSFRDMKVIHLNLFSKDPHNIYHYAADERTFSPHQKELYKKYYNKDIECDGYHREYTQESIQEVIDRLNKHGFLVQFNHPNWSLNNRDDYINLKGLWGFEIFNYLTELDTGAEYCPNLYDDMIRSGHRLFCSMGDDNHNYNKGFVGSFGGFNYVGVKKLTYENVMDSLEKGNFYASMGPVIKSLVFDEDNRKVIIECSEVVNIIYVGLNRTFNHIYGENLTSGSFDIPVGEEHFRIAIKDKNGLWATTSYYFLEDLKNY